MRTFPRALPIGLPIYLRAKFSRAKLYASKFFSVTRVTIGKFLSRRIFSLRLLLYIYSLILWRFSRAVFSLSMVQLKRAARELRKNKRLSYSLALVLFLGIFISFSERIVAANLQATLERSDEPSALAFGSSASNTLASHSPTESLLELASANSSANISLDSALGSPSDEDSRTRNLRNLRNLQRPAPPTRTSYRVITHSVEGSLYQTAYRHDIPLQILRRFVDVMSYDVDFQREIWAGAHFRMLVSQDFELGTGGLWHALEEARLEVAELDTGSGSQYRYHRAAGTDSFYDETGKPAKRLLRRTPMSGLRLTSRFGARRHPILGYTRMHKGVDFAAPRGTPILAAGDGVVRRRAYSRKGYGRYIVLRHNERLSTLYAHMRSFAKGVRVGKRVKQGGIIGYVGTSGLSTGPHLHYEIHVGKRAVNPRTVRLPERRPLAASALSSFMEHRAIQNRLLATGGDRPLPSARDRLRGLVWLAGR